MYEIRIRYYCRSSKKISR